MSANVHRVLHQTQDMIAWYWSHGYRRTERARLSGDWIIDLYRQRIAARALHNLVQDDRRMIAVWGPSQAGKSTMLSSYFDAPGEPCSALCWQETQPIRFQHDKEQPKIAGFNPHNGGNDASGCAARFSMTDVVSDPAHPIQVILLERPQILQAIAAGYLSECELKPPGGKIVQLDEQVVRSLLENQEQPHGETPNKQAVEFLVDALDAIGRLIAEGSTRFANLDSDSKKEPGQSVWHAELVREILDHKGLASSLARAQAFSFELLWDGRLNHLFARLDAYHRNLIERFGPDAKIYCQAHLAAYIVDIAAYRRLAGHARGELVESFRQDLLLAAKWQTQGGRTLLAIGGQGQPLFNSADDFGYFQGLVWELRVPLRRDFILERSPAVADFFGEADLLDVPGVSEFEAGQQQVNKVNPEALAGTLTETLVLLSDVLKRGKTATIINRYANEMRIDLLLILQKAMTKPAKPAQLNAGAMSIWQQIDPDFKPGKAAKRPPVPTVLCLTFMATLIDRIHKVGTAKSDLTDLEARLQELGPLADPDVVEIFATTYPQYSREGAVDLDPRTGKELLDWMIKQPFVQHRFRSEAALGSLEAVMTAEDGGVEYLISALTQRVGLVSRDERVASATERIEEAIGLRLKQAVPVRDEASDRHREIIHSFTDRISQALAASDPREENLALEVSRHLRRLFAFEPGSFKSLPLNIDASHRTELKLHVERELSAWADRADTFAALKGLGVPPDDQPILLAALRANFDVDEITNWVAKRIGEIKDIGVARQARRYLAARCGEALLKRKGIGDGVSDPFDAKFHSYLANQFEEWTAESRTGSDSPHYTKIIEPILDTLLLIADQNIENRWAPQPGDQEIEGLATSWNGGTMNAASSAAVS